MKIPRECRLCLGREICGLGCLSRGNEMCRDFHNAIESKITVRRKPPVQQRKGENAPDCHACGRSPSCGYRRNGKLCREWYAAHLSPVA